MANAKNAPAPGDSPLNWDEKIEYLRGLAHIVKDEKLSELTVEEGGVRLHLQSAAGTMVAVPVAGAPASDAPPAAKAESGAVPIVSPMVGVFYRAPSPADPSFVEVGDTVHVGQVVGVVEAMKVFNEITSEIEGTVAEIVAQNAQLVETGAPLILVKKS